MHKQAIIVLLLTLLTGCTSESVMKIEQPYYYIKLHMQSCYRLIAVNGFEVESDYGGQSSAAEIPINHLIKNGNNYFEMMVPNRENVEKNWKPNTTCVAEVRVSGEVNGDVVDYKVADISFSPNYDGPSSDLYKGSMKAGTYEFSDGETVINESAKDSAVGEIEMISPGYDETMNTTFRRSFVANVPFPTWAFFSADTLFDGYHPLGSDEEYDAAEDVIWPKVEEMWDLFESRDLEKILPFFEFRSKEYDQAFYREPGNTLGQLKNSLENVYASNYPLNRKDREYMQMVVTFSNNLVTIVNAATYNGTVMFYDRESDSNTFYTIYWMKKDGEWIIAR